MTPPRAERYADWFTAAVIASIAIALAGLTWRLVAGASSSAPPVVVTAVPPSAVDIAPIVALAPFGNGADGAPIPTTLPIELRGVIRTIPASASTALIAPTGGVPIAYAVGQPVPGGGTIETIGTDTVILAIGGHREILAFPRPDAPAAPGVAGSQPPATRIESATPATGALAQSPQSILEGLAATPTSGGYRIGDAIAPVYRQSGLQPGDVIEQINGTRLGNPATDQQLLADAMRSGTVRIDIARAGRRMTLSFPVR